MHHSPLRLMLALLVCAAAPLSAQETITLSSADVNAIYQSKNRTMVSIHDPSVVHAEGSTFYALGSHRGWGTSTDNMINWRGLNGDQLFGRLNANGTAVQCAYADAFSTNATTSVRTSIGGVVQEVAFGNFDAKAWANADQAGWSINGNMWAPDIIYNPNSDKWMMYMSINGDAWHSVIVLLTADRITGPYVYQGPVHFSGFINGTNPAISWKKTDLEIVLGEQTSLPARYNKGGDWGTWWTNDIDPCVFFDEEGELWMTYGSWSGGIFILRLDKQTGLRDYTYTYALTNDGQGRALTDPYFGKRIAGGYYASGEGSYVQHIGNYYYLFMSYGGFAPDGGYEMRLFRSATPDGKYVDANNLDACYHDRYWLNYGPNAQTDGGMKLMGSYNGWGFQTVGECAQGHNSATADAKGRNFVVYHTKFNDGTAGHQVRTRQLFLNSQGWPCAAPFQFDGETVNDDSIAAGCHYAKDEIPGTYDVLIHRYRLNHSNMEEVTPVSITLTDNGRVTGALTGTWKMTAGTAQIILTLGSTAYYGVVVPQVVDGTTLPAIGITAQARSGVSLWAYRLEDKAAVAYNAKQYTMPVRNNQSVSRSLPLAEYVPTHGATVTWTSSRPDVITNDGEYIPTDEDTRITLTCTIAAGRYAYEQTFTVTAQRAVAVPGDVRTGLVAYYDFNAKPQRNAYDESQTATLTRVGNGQSANIVDDATRYGGVLTQSAGAARAESCTRMPNPLQGLTDMEGFTVSVWVRRGQEDDALGTLWSITDKQGQLGSVAQRFFVTGNANVVFETADDNFSINAPNINSNGKITNATGYIPAGEWSLLTLTASAADGVSVYVNGAKKAHKSFTSSAGSASNVSQAARLFDYQKLLDAVASAGYFQFGVGGKNGSAEARFDDLLIYSRPLSATDVRALYILGGRRTDYGPDAGNGIALTPAREGRRLDNKSYDLSGRPATPATRGIVVTGGRKIMR